MMLFRLTTVLRVLLLIGSTNVMADFATPPSTTGNASQDTSNIAKYLQNLGAYFGYDLTEYCKSGGPCGVGPGGQGPAPGEGAYSNTLLNENDTFATQLNLLNSTLGAMMGGGSPDTLGFNPIVPTDGSSPYSLLNTLAGQTYTKPPYASPSSTGVSASRLIDQANGDSYQNDPVSQAVLNILSTPNYTYCSQNDSQKRVANCPYLFREKITSDVIGTFKGTQDVFTTEANQPLVSQLNSNTLISPLMYSITPTNNDSSPGNGGKNNPGLTARTQAQQAANFIRYATGSANPVQLLDRTAYDKLVNVAENFSKSSTPEEQDVARAQLSNYLIKLRSYAAQASVPVGNLYYILSKRIPQNPVSGSGTPSSEALNEFIMASWRLYNPNTKQSSGQPDQQWLTKINHASSATVQKEIAILLAEINYQLYLSRQQQERMMLAQSIMLMQNTIVTQQGLSAATPQEDSSSGIHE